MTAKRVYRGCLNKRRYADEGTAAVHAQYRVGRGAPPLRPYACNVCKGWHLTKRVPANVEVTGARAAGDEANPCRMASG